MRQLCLIIEHDYTVEGKELRVFIDGKKCDGFTYGLTFSERRPDDREVFLFSEKKLIGVLLDPFTAKYLKNFTIDYQQGFDQNGSPLDNDPEENFKVINHDQDLYQGKFWSK